MSGKGNRHAQSMPLEPTTSVLPSWHFRLDLLSTNRCDLESRELIAARVRLGDMRNVTLSCMLVALLALSSCASDGGDVVAGSPDGQAEPGGEDPTKGTDVDDEPTVDGDTPVTSPPNDTSDVTPIVSRDDLTQLQPITIDDVYTTDGSSVFIAFEGGAEPCFGAAATVSEEGNVVEVLLQSGLTPEAPTTTCIAVVLSYEMEIPLTQPLGDRTLEIHPDSRSTNRSIGSEATEYIGLATPDAEALADEQNLEFRVLRIDDESFDVTDDATETRVNVEIEDDTVVTAYIG